MRPPVGLVYRDDGVLILDPDDEIQTAMRLVFETFDRTGSAMRTVKLFHEQGLRFPRCIRKGLNKGELHWVQAQHSRIIQVLHNPRYAGAFVYGRVHTRLLPNGKHSTTKVPRSDWQFVIPGVHIGYITWEQFEANQKRLAENALGFGRARKGGPAREGPALLQGRVICGICGERMGIHYNISLQPDGSHLRLRGSFHPEGREGLSARSRHRRRQGHQRPLAGTDAATYSGGRPRGSAGSRGTNYRNRRVAAEAR
jgi:hypothetical protein